MQTNRKRWCKHSAAFGEKKKKGNNSIPLMYIEALHAICYIIYNSTNQNERIYKQYIRNMSSEGEGKGSNKKE